MPNSRFNHVKISGFVTIVPDNSINIDEEIRFYDNDPKKLERNKKILGLGTRYVLKDGITCLDLCEEAARHLIKELNIDKDTIDGVVVTSNCHEYCSPADACIIHGRLGLNNNCNCFDISGLSCSSYVYSLMVISSLIESGVMKRCLLLTGDMNSIHSDVRNRNSNMLYSDAGSATLIEYSEKEILSWYDSGTDGNGWDKIIVPASGAKLPVRNDIADIEVIDNDGNVWHLWDEILKGFDIFQFTMTAAPVSVKNLLEYSEKTVDDIDFFPMHQANGQIVKNVAMHAGIPKDKFSNETFTKFANCGAPSVLSNICDVLQNKKVKDVMLVSFGVGLSWGCCIINVEDTYNGGVIKYKLPDYIPTREERVNKWIKYYKGEIDRV